MLKLKFRSLEASGQLLPDGLLDHPRTGEADQRSRLGEHHVPEAGVAGADAAGRRVRKHGDIESSVLGKPSGRGARLRHLKKREHAFLHPGAAAGGKNHQRELLPVRLLKGERQLLARDSPHAAHQERFSQLRAEDRNPVHKPSPRRHRVL